MADRDDDRFRVRPGPPKQRGDTYVNQVLRKANQAGAGLGKRLGKAGRQPGARLGRGHVAARFGRGLGPNAQRATVKVRLVNLAKAGPRSMAKHLRYIQRDGVDRQGGPGRAYGPATDDADLGAFQADSRDDRHQFRLIVSPENAEQIDDLRTYTRHLMARMEADLGTELTWVAVDHWNTDNPHTHVVLRGKDQTGNDLIIARDYIAHGMRQRAAELATEWLGPRTELEIRHAMQREVEQERWTGLDRALAREVNRDGWIDTNRLKHGPQHRELLIGRLQQLQRMGLAKEHHGEPGAWTLRRDIEPTLRALGERGDILRTMQRAMSGRPRELAIFQPGGDGRPLVGRVAGKGLADELRDTGYLVVDGADGKAHYVALPAKAELEHYPVGAVVQVRAPDHRAVDKEIADLVNDGVYRTDHCLSVVAQYLDGGDPSWIAEKHVRRLEALRRAGIVERLEDGVWTVPDNLPEHGRRYDARRFAGGVPVDLKSHLPIERQTRAIGATWLDQQLIGGGAGLADVGFGGEVKQALRERGEYLVEEGLAEKRGGRLLLARSLLARLRQRDLTQAGQALAAETGLDYRPAGEGQRVSGVYRRSVQLASGRFAMLDDGIGFALVPWKPVIEPRLGQTLAATVRGGEASWALGRQRGPSVG
ncbi:MAG: relaxase/mobilization nuclease and DUF3363 domain-containing protein [Dokdonella sp.]|nr:relaxase/mobilization nuclease and DUF3363 domain-containing protein [Dokdonella sp.]